MCFPFFYPAQVIPIGAAKHFFNPAAFRKGIRLPFRRRRGAAYRRQTVNLFSCCLSAGGAASRIRHSPLPFILPSLGRRNSARRVKLPSFYFRCGRAPGKVSIPETEDPLNGIGKFRPSEHWGRFFFFSTGSMSFGGNRTDLSPVERGFGYCNHFFLLI